MCVELRLELLKLLRKPRTFIGPAAMALLTAAVLVGLKYGHEFDYIRERLAQQFYIAGTIVNAAFLARYLLQGIVYTFLPLFACMVCGDLLASEAADGTMRTMLCRPVSRLKVAAAKYVIGSIYVLALTFGTGILAYLAGSAFLGRGSLVNLNGGIWILSERDAVLRLAAVYTLVAAGMIAVGSTAFALSTFLSNSNGAIAGAMGIMYGSMVIGQIEFFSKVRPYLFTTYLDTWRQFFTGAYDMHLFAKSVAVMLLYSAVALIAGLAIFQRRDVLA